MSQMWQTCKNWCTFQLSILTLFPSCRSPNGLSWQSTLTSIPSLLSQSHPGQPGIQIFTVTVTCENNALCHILLPIWGVQCNMFDDYTSFPSLVLKIAKTTATLLGGPRTFLGNKELGTKKKGQKSQNLWFFFAIFAICGWRTKPDF